MLPPEVFRFSARLSLLGFASCPRFSGLFVAPPFGRLSEKARSSLRPFFALFLLCSAFRPFFRKSSRSNDRLLSSPARRRKQKLKRKSQLRPSAARSPHVVLACCVIWKAARLPYDKLLCGENIRQVGTPPAPLPSSFASGTDRGNAKSPKICPVGLSPQKTPPRLSLGGKLKSEKTQNTRA